MSKRTGPVRRVRNVRNVDLAATPLPYPITWIPVLENIGVDELQIGFRDPNTWDQIGDMDMSAGPLTSFVTDDDVHPESIVVVGVGSTTLILTFAAGGLDNSQQLRISGWQEAWRGPNGQWMAPAQLSLLP